MSDQLTKRPASTSTTPPVDIKILKQKFIEHFAEYVTLGRKTVHAAWLAGEALCAVKAELPHGSFRLYLENQGVNRTTAGNLMRLAREIQMAKLLSFGSVDAALKSIPAKTPSRPEVDPLEPTEDEDQGFEDEVPLEVVEYEAEAEVKHCHVTANSGEMEWYTPPDIMETVHSVLGDFLDPASCAAAQETVNASKFFTIEDDGLSREWTGNVFMNPPYERGLVDQFVGKLVTEKGVKDWVVLVNNATDTAWGQVLLKYGRAVCFVERRVRFLSPDGEQGAPLQGQMIVGKVADSKRFINAFGEHGTVLLCETQGVDINGLSDALAVQTERGEKQQEVMELARRTDRAQKRRLGAVKNALLNDVPIEEILLKNFGVRREGAEQQAALGVQDRG